MNKTITQLKWLAATIMLVAAVTMPKTAWADESIIQTEPSQVNGVYQIGTAGQLMWFMQQVKDGNESYSCQLTADIVLNTNLLETLEEGKTPVNQWIMPEIITGTFDGNGHTISGIYMPSTDGSDFGMFVSNEGIIKNLGVLDSYFGGSGNYYVGTFAGRNYNTITDCYSFAKIEGKHYIAGIAGYSYQPISNCYFAGTVISTSDYSSPISSDDSDVLTNCYYLESSKNEEMRANNCTAVTQEEMTNGKLTCMLQNNRETLVWGQQIEGESKDSHPVIGGARVYASHLLCSGKSATDATFSNTETTITQDEHSYGEPVVHPSTCTKEGYTSKICGNCGYEEKTNIQPALGHIDEDNDGICDRDRYVYTTMPEQLTAERCTELGLPAEYTGFFAIKTLNDLAWIAEGIGSPLQAATEATATSSAAKAFTPATSLSLKSKAQAYTQTRSSEFHLRIVLLNDIVVNNNVLKADGTANDRDSEGNFRNDLLLWTPWTYEFPITIDGNGHTISGLYQNCFGITGLLAVARPGSTITNLGITNSYFEMVNQQYIAIGGIFVGQNVGNIENCWTDATINCVNNLGTYTGGITGSLTGGNITNCEFRGNIITNNTTLQQVSIIGGISPYVNTTMETNITNCKFTGKIQQNGVRIAIASGIAATEQRGSEAKLTIENCYAGGEIHAENIFSGIVGGILGGSDGEPLSNLTVRNNCFNTNVTFKTVGNKADSYGLFSTLTTIDGDEITGNVNLKSGVPTYSTLQGNGLMQNNYSLGDTYNATDTKNIIVTESQMNSGEVTVALNGNQPYGSKTWGQQIGIDLYPVIGSNYKVFKAAKGDNDTYWATFSNQSSDMDLRGLTVYTAKVSEGKMALTPCSDTKVAKGEGVLVKGNSEYLNAKMLNTGTEMAETNNNLVATPADPSVIDAESGHVLYRLTYNTGTSDLGFYLGVMKDANGSVLSNNGSQLKTTPNKAYLDVTTAAATPSSSNAPALGFAFPSDGETTGISEIFIEGNAGIHSSACADGRIYNLQGQQVSAPAKGLYIKNNKKVIVK